MSVVVPRDTVVRATSHGAKHGQRALEIEFQPGAIPGAVPAAHRTLGHARVG